MKKKILSGLFALALLVATGYGVSQTMKSDVGLNDLALMNVEALARGESELPECLKPYDQICRTDWVNGIRYMGYKSTVIV